MIPKGFHFAGVRCGLKNKRNDLGLVVSDLPCAVGGVFTQNLVRAACVDDPRERIGRPLRALVVNSGNANCCTGEQGVRDVDRMAELAAAHLSIEPNEVAVAQTGVIGQLIDMAKVEHGIAEATSALGDDTRGFQERTPEVFD